MLYLIIANLLVVSCIRPDSPNLRKPIFATLNGPATISDIPSSVSKQSLVSNISSFADVEETAAFLTKMTMFPDRYFKSGNGVAAAEWIVRHCKIIASMIKYWDYRDH